MTPEQHAEFATLAAITPATRTAQQNARLQELETARQKDLPKAKTPKG